MANKRSALRYALRGNISGTFRNARGEAMEILLIDISKRGMGLLVSSGPAAGEQISLELFGADKQKLSFQVKWSANKETEELPGINMRRCGLQVMEDGVDLVEIVGKMREIQIDK
jgi:hypothetical protein